MTDYVGSFHDVYPYSSVVWVSATFPDGAMYVGSGVMVGPNDVLTADHMVYSVLNGGAATSVTVYPGYDGGEQPFGSHAVAHFDYKRADVTGEGRFYEWESDDDYALLALNDNIGYSTGMMGFDSNPGSGNYNVTGYPGVYATDGYFRMTNDSGYITKDLWYDTWNTRSVEVNAGNSGGPVWYDDGSGPKVVGIVSTALWAADISERLGEIQGWMAANDSYMTDWGLTPGNDAVTGHDLSDTINGNQGNDTILGADGDDFLRGGRDSDTLYGNQGNDSIFGDRSADMVRGGKGADYIRGGKENDALYGDNDADIVYGDLGNDSLWGGKLNDILYGGDGDDRLTGDLGDDTLTGDGGADVFYARPDGGADVVTDFNTAEGDRVGVSGGYTFTVTDSGLLVDTDGTGTLLLQGIYSTVDVFTTTW